MVVAVVVVVAAAVVVVDVVAGGTGHVLSKRCFGTVSIQQSACTPCLDTETINRYEFIYPMSSIKNCAFDVSPSVSENSLKTSNVNVASVSSMCSVLLGKMFIVLKLKSMSTSYGLVSLHRNCVVFRSSNLHSCVGDGVGDTLGASVGEMVGDNVGDKVGDSLGESVGLSEGETLGAFVGLSVGELVGVSVGVSVGRKVGKSVGDLFLRVMIFSKDEIFGYVASVLCV